MNILVTGGAGFVGHHLVRRLSQNGFKIIIIDNLSNSKKNIEISDLDKRITFYKEDIRNKETIADIIKRERIDTCIHLAAKISVKDSILEPFETVDVNVNGTLAMLNACARNDVRSFIFASSAAVYGSARVLPIPEDHVLEPLSPYGASKVSGESLVTSYKASGKIKNAISLRFFNIYGEGQSPQYAGVITRFAERLSKGLPPIIFGNGEQTRDFVSVNDVVNAIMQAAEADNGISGIFNIGTGRPISINELARKMIGAFNLGIEPIYGDAPEGDIMHSCADITSAREILRYSPVDRIESSLMQSLGWLKPSR